MPNGGSRNLPQFNARGTADATRQAVTPPSPLECRMSSARGRCVQPMGFMVVVAANAGKRFSVDSSGDSCQRYRIFIQNSMPARWCRRRCVGHRAADNAPIINSNFAASPSASGLVSTYSMYTRFTAFLRMPLTLCRDISRQERNSANPRTPQSQACRTFRCPRARMPWPRCLAPRRNYDRTVCFGGSSCRPCIAYRRTRECRRSRCLSDAGL